VFAVDTSTNEVTASFETGKRPWGIAVSPDGKMLFAADGPSNELVIIDLQKQTTVKRVKVGDSPWGVITISR
jgi:YVTN family beta-propeller protein